MRTVTHLTALTLLCLVGNQQAQAQPEPHIGGGVSMGELASVRRGQPAAHKLPPDSPERCARLSVDVTAGTQDEHSLVCSAAGEALQLLGRCNITPVRPLHVQIMSDVRRPFGEAIFGLFDVKQENVLVTKESNVPTLVENTPYASLPMREFYKSLIVHEVVHGVMHQNLKRKATTHAAYEYPAYALQIQSLPPHAREKFLFSFDQAALNSNTLFHDAILFFDPYFFAARAYHHFTSAPDSCAHLTNLLAGEVAFIGPPM